ncbi:hypothetical protein AAG570_010257 [Ranatra chinensis]|uniref:Orn/DAP/Arg decarboxylase 2 N-terminal domain-containing protein n=1 Tax=Ranatra chinensis TaxID=642074 RepID=A0ABD0YM15_9HEMI
MASKRRNMFYENKKQETTEIEEKLSWKTTNYRCPMRTEAEGAPRCLDSTWRAPFRLPFMTVILCLLRSFTSRSIYDVLLFRAALSSSRSLNSTLVDMQLDRSQVVRIVPDGFDPIGYMREIASDEELDDPFMVTDLTEIWRQWNAWKSICPNVHPYFQLKSNRSRPVLEVLAALGVGFTCSTKVEMEAALSVGVDPGSVMLGTTMKLVNHIGYAAQAGVRLMLADSTEEMEKIRRYHTDPKLILVVRGDKSGEASEEFRSLLEKADRLKMPVVGLSLQLGNETSTTVNLVTTAVNQAADWGHTIRTIVLTPTPHTLDVLRQAGELAESSAGRKLEVVVQDDRLLVEGATKSAAKVLALTRRSNDPLPKCFLNDGFYGTFNLARRRHCQRVLGPAKPLHKESPTGDGECWQVWGPTCDTVDLVGSGCRLPPIHPGHWIVFSEMGAYSTTNSCAFNGYHPPTQYYIIQDTPWRLLQSHLTLTAVHKSQAPMP